MKNLFAAIFVLSMIFISCGGDDCKTCTLGSDSSEICDNGDGTVTFTETDGSVTIDSTEFSVGIALLEALGATCK